MKKIILTFISIAAVFGCSSGSGNEEITLVDQVTDSEQIFTIEDFKQIVVRLRRNQRFSLFFERDREEWAIRNLVIQ